MLLRLDVIDSHERNLSWAAEVPDRLTLAYFFGANVTYGLTLWLPKMVEKLSGLSVLLTTLITAIPFVVAWPAMLLVGWSSDRNREGRWHTATMLFLAAAGLGLTRLNGGVD